MKFLKNAGLVLLAQAIITGARFVAVFIAERVSAYVDKNANYGRLFLYSLVSHITATVISYVYYVPAIAILYVLRFEKVLVWVLCVGVTALFIFATVTAYAAVNEKLHQHNKGKAFIFIELIIYSALHMPLYIFAYSVLDVGYPEVEWTIYVKFAIKTIMLLSVIISTIVCAARHKKYSVIPHDNVLQEDIQ